MYAVIEDSGTQIRVAEGDVIRVDPRDLPEDVMTVTFDRVLLVSDDEGEPKIGQPLVAGARVTADILEEGRTDKVAVTKYKRRKGYKRRKTHRQEYLQVRVTSIKA
jgi:large subunit ribosomal protein L21